MTKVRFSLILAFLVTAVVLLASAGPAHADDPWPDGWRVMHLDTPSRDLLFVDPLRGWGSNYNNRVLRAPRMVGKRGSAQASGRPICPMFL